MKTAMMQLEEWLDEQPTFPGFSVIKDKIDELLELEKQQIKDAYDFGWCNCAKYVVKDSNTFYYENFNNSNTPAT